MSQKCTPWSCLNTHISGDCREQLLWWSEYNILVIIRIHTPSPPSTTSTYTAIPVYRSPSPSLSAFIQLDLNWCH